MHFVLEHFRLYTLGFEHAGHFIGHLVYFHVGHHVIVHLHGGQLFFSATMSASLSTSMSANMSTIFYTVENRPSALGMSDPINE